jgi:hypothetical protein
MPYGTYDVCATSGGKTDQALNVANTNPAVKARTLNLTSPGPSC